MNDKPQLEGTPGSRAADRPTAEALATLVSDGTITAEQAERVAVALRAQETPRISRGVWVEIAGYVGAVLMVGGAVWVLGSAWSHLSDAARASVLSAITAALVGAAVLLAARTAAAARRRLASVLLALAAATAAGTVAILVDTHRGVAASAVGFAVAVGGYAYLRLVPGMLATAIASVALTAAVADEIAPTGGPRPSGVAFLILGLAWTAAAVLRIAPPAVLAGAIAVPITLLGAQQLAGEQFGSATAYLATFAVGALFLALYRRYRLVPLLFGGVLAAAIAAPELVWDVTDGAAGGASILVTAGAILVAASVWGLRHRHPHRHEPIGR